MMKHISALAAVVLGAAFSAPVAAQVANPWYLGGSIGMGQYKDSCKDLIIPCESTDAVYRVFGGYRFSKYWAVEAGYTDLGPVDGDGVIASGPAALQIRSYGFDGMGLLYAPLSESFSAYFTGGFYRIRTKATVATSDPAIGVQSSGGTNSGWSYGLGLQLDLGRFGFRAGWQRYENVGTSSTGEDDIDTINLGMLFRF